MTAAYEFGEPIVEPMKRRKRRPTVAAVVQQLKRAGVEVAGVKLNPDDGTITVLTGKLCLTRRGQSMPMPTETQHL